MTLEMKLAEERKEGYTEGHTTGFVEGAAEQRAKDEAELRQKESELASQAEEIFRLKAELEELHGKLAQ